MKPNDNEHPKKGKPDCNKRRKAKPIYPKSKAYIEHRMGPAWFTRP